MFFHSFIQAISIAPLQVHYYSEVLPTQHEYCVGATQATASEGLAQGPYVAARAGFEAVTLWTKVAESTNEPAHPTSVLRASYKLCMMRQMLFSHQKQRQFQEL